MQICVIEDNRMTMNVIKALLQRVKSYNVEAFTDPNEAMARCDTTIFDIVLVDYQMAEMNGVECITHLRNLADYQHVPIIMLTADRDRDLRVAAVSAGATDFLSKPFDTEELRLRVKNLLSLRQAQLSLADRARHLDQEIAQATRTIIKREQELIWRLALAIETRDGNTGEHISRVATISKLVARHLGMDHAFCRTLYLAAPLHDTGKIGIPDAVLNKEGPLTEEETALVQSHTDIGRRILEGGDSALINMACEVALTHHEKWDGSGYGQGLKGDDIPISGRIVAVADVFDALCTERPYKAAWAIDDAYAEIQRLSGIHFDPECVMALVAARPEIEAVYTAPSRDVTAA